jgi:hypothetical protein
MIQRIALVAVLWAACASAARAHDPWDLGRGGDDDSLTRNTLGLGIVQQHDLEEGPGAVEDVDWAVVPTVQYHSYEARISGTNVGFDWGPCPSCAQFELVDRLGVVLAEDVSTVTDAINTPVYDRSVRWLMGGSTSADSVGHYTRVRGHLFETETAASVYTLRYWDTTYMVPRWNASGGQTTVLVVTSHVQGTIAARVSFFSGTGGHLLTQAVGLTRNTPLVLNTGALPNLAGQSGFALIAHTGGYGALTGKSVALEPSTGFTFDTVIAPIPQ